MATPVSGRNRPSFRRFLSPPVILAALAIVVFAFYQYILPNLVQPVQDFFDGWLPITTVNQCLIWAMLAVGLNIVVGYAGLLDLGYVAFWAIGGYVAAWIMSPFFTQWSVNIFGSAPPRLEAGHPLKLSLGLPPWAAVWAPPGRVLGPPTAPP